jgi:hypothetical protein
MLKSSLIAVPVTLFVILVTGFLSELCCCASPMAAVFLGLLAGALCAQFEKPTGGDKAVKRGAIAGVIAGLAALPAQILGEIVVALLLAGSGKVDISLFGLPDARATVDLWNWVLNALCAASLYGLITAAVMAGMGAVGGAVWMRFIGKRIQIPESGSTPEAQELHAELPEPAPNNSGKMILSGIIMAGVAFVFLLLILTNWGCLALPAAAILGIITGILTVNLARPRTAKKAAVFGGIAGWIASSGALLGSIAGLLIRTFLIQTPQGINSINAGLYGMLGMAGAHSTQTPIEILAGDIPVVCCCGIIYFVAFVGLGALGGYLRFKR